MADLSLKKPRREFRNIHVTQIVGYRLPIAGFMSILHRISGAIMFLLLPFLVYLLDLSLTSELSYARLVDLSSSIPAKIVLTGLAWAFIHHFMGGIRHLVNDLHIGITKEASPRMAQGFMAASLLVTALAALKIFGAF